MDLRIKRRIERSYASSIGRIFGRINAAVEGLTYLEAMHEIIRITESSEFNRMVELSASRMISMVRADGEKTWRKAAARGSYGRSIYEALRKEMSQPIMRQTIADILEGNAQLIKSVSVEAAQHLAEMVYLQYLRGNRAAGTAARIKKDHPLLRKSRAALIARTETSKASSAITQARSEQVGADWYIWKSSHDERVRSSHNFMDGVLINWNEAPNPEILRGERNKFGHYHAGCCPNCRCYSDPVIVESQIVESVRVYRSGSIVRMRKRKFMEMAGMID